VAQFRENNSLANADALAKVLLLVSTARKPAAAAKTRCQDKPGQVELACQLGLLVDTHGGDGGGRSNFIISEHEPRM
jgi:hypothetical protein